MIVKVRTESKVIRYYEVDVKSLGAAYHLDFDDRDPVDVEEHEQEPVRAEVVSQ